MCNHDDIQGDVLKEHRKNIEMFEEVKDVLKSRKCTYEVGYGKPPVHTQFKKGQSGNKAGRKKKNKPKSLKDSITAELSTVVSITNERGCKEKLALFELFGKQLVKDAIKKDGYARRFIIENYFKFDLFKLLEDQLAQTEEKTISRETRDRLLEFVNRTIHQQMEEEEREEMEKSLLSQQNKIEENSLNENN